MRNELGDVRRSQVITTYGPGSIVDFRAGGYGGAGVSVVVAGLEAWDSSAPPSGLGHPQTIFEPRLQKQLGIGGFRLPPVAPQVGPGTYSPHAGKLIGVRFPRWLQCPRCHILRESRRWAEDAGDPALYCAECSLSAGGRNRVHVVPVRFIVICENGHLDEFPWHWWVGHMEGCTQRQDLTLEGSPAAGLAGLLLTCMGCGAKRSMEGCFGPDAIPGKCQGRRPWLGSDADDGCSQAQRVVQRGASNIYFAVLESALDIPPWSEALQKKIGVRWAMLERAEGPSARRTLIQALRLPHITGMAEDDLVEAVEDRVKRLQEPHRSLRWEEYQHFVQHSRPFGDNTEFEIRPALAPPEIAPWIEKVIRATRLREVRVLRGFTRVFPPASARDSRVARISRRTQDWLPAVENRGEGIFLSLRRDKVFEWETSPAVIERVARINKAYASSHRQRHVDELPREVSARHLLVHSLAHALIRQLALSCGYGSSSLRERLYVDVGDWDMAGLLVFTSSPDADGTLGGLARQGETGSIVRVFEDCLASMSWCSSDPLCIEDVHAATAPANGAACHACLLASETSCEEFNAFLDRAMLVGTPERPELGYFHGFSVER
jgi:hypothetical protein